MTARERADAFATCAGLYAAEASHGWLRAEPGASEDAEVRRDGFLDLVAAAAPGAEGAGRGVSLRAALVQARLTQRHLLERAAFAPRAEDRRTAGRAAALRRAACDRLLLGA